MPAAESLLGQVDLPTRRATIHLAQRLAPLLTVGDLLILSGQLGTGKTFFARALCRGLGVPSDVRITSPSFSLLNHYEGRIPIGHADLYRVGHPEEVEQLGLRELRHRALLLVEWGESYAELLGDEQLRLTLRLEGEKRSATLHALLSEPSRAEQLAASVLSP